jgi:hypothetical protein
MQYHCNTGNQDMPWNQCDFITIEIDVSAKGCLGRKQGKQTYSSVILHALETLPCVLRANIHDEVAVPLTRSANLLHVNDHYFYD